MGIEQLEKKYERLKNTLTELGPAIQGSILRRVIVRENSEHPKTRKEYGPYFQWTRKIKGRTVMQNLTPAQAKAYARAIEQNRKLEKIIADMRATSLRILDLTTQEVQQEKRKRNQQGPLS